MRSDDRRTGLGLAWTALVGLVAALVLGCATHSPSSASIAPPPGALQPPATPHAAASYRIQVYDELHIRFPFQPNMDEQLPVRPDGRISLASTGEIAVIGLTPSEIEHLVAEKSAARLRNPQVVVVVTKVAEQHVYVGGEVRKAGYVVLVPDMTPLQAIMESGGFLETGKKESVVLLTPGPGGKFSAVRMDLEQVVNDGVPERVRLHPGDVVYVPRTWIADMDVVVDQWVRGLIPALPHVGVGYSL